MSSGPHVVVITVIVSIFVWLSFHPDILTGEEVALQQDEITVFDTDSGYFTRCIQTVKPRTISLGMRER